MSTATVDGRKTAIRGGNNRDTARPEETSRPAVVKLSFNVAQRQFDDLKKLSEEKNVSMTEILRHAIALESYLQNEAAADYRIVLEKKDGTDRRELVLFGP